MPSIRTSLRRIHSHQRDPVATQAQVHDEGSNQGDEGDLAVDPDRLLMLARTQAMHDDCPVNTLILRIVQLLGVLWTSPNTLVGLVVGAVAMACGARASFRDAALVFDQVPFGPGGALTLGNVILNTGESMDQLALTYACRLHGGTDCVRIGDHERAHVYQYLALGPLFLPLYFFSGGIAARNRFEQAADHYAATGRGWWPWPRRS